MSLPEDISWNLSRIGTHLTVVRSSETFSGEYVDFEANSQVTKPFIREHFLEALLKYDSVIRAGDLVRTDLMDYYLTMHLTEDFLENVTISKSAVFYKCNVSGELSRVSGEVRDSFSYKKTPVYSILKNPCYALMTSTMVGTDILQDEPIGQIETTLNYLYIPKELGVRALDRYTPYSGEHYKIESIERFRFEGIDVCSLVEDTLE